MSDLYRQLGLGRNPFVAEAHSGVPEELWVERGYGPPAPAGTRLVQLLGPNGAGKTSLLLRWQHAQPGPYYVVPSGPGRYRLPPVAPLAYWDEADRLPLLALALWRARAAAATVVAASHIDLSPAARRHGLAVETVALPALDSATLGVWAARRIAAARLRETAVPPLTIDDATLRVIAASSGASWRVAGDLLHAWVAEQARNAQERRG